MHLFWQFFGATCTFKGQKLNLNVLMYVEKLDWWWDHWVGLDVVVRVKIMKWRDMDDLLLALYFIAIRMRTHLVTQQSALVRCEALYRD